MSRLGEPDSTKRNEAARKKVKQEHDAAKEYVQRLSEQKYPPRVLEASRQARLSRRFGQGL